MTSTLKDKIAKLPNEPGVYIMMDEQGKVLYIGKAKVLKNRVKQYFARSSVAHEKVRIMMNHVRDFRYIICASEMDALTLENNLIKEHKPPYNILLKDDKHFAYVRLTAYEDFPRIEIIRKVKKDRAKYFGPIGGSSREFTDLIKQSFPLVSCKHDFSKLPKNHRPCLNHHIGRCLAPCNGKITKEEYARIIARFTEFLKGDDSFVVKTLTEKMLEASQNEEYEKALNIKQQLEQLTMMREKRITNLTKLVDFDAFALFTDGQNTAVNVSCVRSGKVVVCENIPVNDASLSEPQAISSFLTQYYANNVLTVKEIAVNIVPEDCAVVEAVLSEIAGRKVSIAKPDKGVKKDVVNMAERNLKDYLEKSKNTLERKFLSTVGAVGQLKELLNMKNLPMRMECFDISNISGVDKVAAMAVFKGGERQNSQYRRFRIRTVEGADDFASMSEAVARRLQKIKDGNTEFGKQPDLIVVDGGLGQLHAAQREIEKSGLGIELISLAERNEEVYTLHDNKPVILPRESYALKLLINLRDETHRFAVDYFRKLHTKNALKSALQEIEGVGEVRQKILFKHFQTIERIEKATLEELEAIEGISKPTAQNIYKHFNLG